MRRFGWLVILVISTMSIAACAQLPGKKQPDLCRGGEPFEQPEYHPDRFLQSAQ